MTPDQAKDIREHLIKQLNSNGFGDIGTEVNTRLEENYEEEQFERNPRYLLDFFLTESIDVLESFSNKNYRRLINRFNEFNSGDNRIEKISVELLNQGESVFFDLQELPNYKTITTTFQEILNEIRREN